ncbi:MAG TPA: transglutaminase family protein, partial [Polyangia bacterium]
MAIKVALTHVTQYRFDRPVELSPHVVRLRPAPHCRTPIPAYSLRVTPADHFLNWQQDPFGNYQARLVFPKPTKELRVEVDLIADLTAINPFDFFLEESAETVPFSYAATLAEELRPYLRAREGEAGRVAGDHLTALITHVRERIALPGRRNIDVLVDINAFIQGRLRYDIRMEPGVFDPEETLERGHGSCRDFAWLQVNLLRHLGYAARFVSGYSIQLRADERPLEGPAGVSEDATDLHAWTEVFLPGAGWVGLDATSGLLCGEGHIPLAATAEPSSAAPVTGAFSWSKAADRPDDKVSEEFVHTMAVRRLEDPPRPTKPYGEAAWNAILACGDRVDEELRAGDVRLTMGGEPTFVSIEDRDGEEWNTAALGPTKAKLADALLRRLQARFAPGGLLHHGQGKWYPGEQLPRWAYSCYFRRDGQPMWKDPALIAGPPADGDAKGAGADEARVFTEALAER